MSCPLASTEGLFQQLPLLTFEILFVYLLISRFSIGFIALTVGFALVCLCYGIFWNLKYKKLFNFLQINDKYIAIPAHTNGSDNNDNDDITIYCYKAPKQSIFDSLNGKYPFAMPQNFHIYWDSIPFEEITATQFIQKWNNKSQTIKPYCIDPFDLSIWFVGICDFDHRFAANQFNWNKTIESSKDCVLYRISKNDFIKFCKSMQQNKQLTTMKNMSSHLCLIFDSDFDDECSMGDNLAYLLKLSANDKCVQFVSNHCAFTALQFRYVQMKQSKNKKAVKQLKSELIALFHSYFLFLYGTITLHSNVEKNVLLKMRTSDLFWNDILFIALPGIKSFFVYQSIYKSIEVSFKYWCRNDAICYFLSFFCADDLYIRHCTPYCYQYMLQETIEKFEEFHSDFLYNLADDDEIDIDDNNECDSLAFRMSNVNIHTRNDLVMSQRDIMIDLGCQILAVFVYVMHCLQSSEDVCDKNEGIVKMKRNFYMIRYDTDLCEKGVDALCAMLKILGWNSKGNYGDCVENKEKIEKLLKATHHKNYYPNCLSKDQQQRLSFLFAQYESTCFVNNIQ